MARILVIDDDPDVLDSLEADLEEEGHTVRAVRGATEALAASPQAFDALLVDLWMRPGPSGVDLKRELNCRAVTAPVILMSSDDNVARQALAVGCCEYLHKPFSPDQLHAAISRALAEGRAAAPLPPREAASTVKVSTTDDDNDGP